MKKTMEKEWTLVRLGLEPECDLIPSGTKTRRSECDGMPGTCVDYHDAECPENRYVQFHSDAQIEPLLVTVPKFVVWFKMVEVTPVPQCKSSYMTNRCVLDAGHRGKHRASFGMTWNWRPTARRRAA